MREKQGKQWGNKAGWGRSRERMCDGNKLVSERCDSFPDKSGMNKMKENTVMVDIIKSERCSVQHRGTKEK